MKSICFTFSLLLIGLTAYAQGPGFGGGVNDQAGTPLPSLGNASGSASQSVVLQLNDAIDITFSATGSNTGGTVLFAFNKASDYASGKQSSEFQIRVRSTRLFVVTVKSSSAYFAVSNGSSSAVSTMPVSSVLTMNLVSNQTGGSSTAAYAGQFGAITSGDQNLITSGQNGGNQWFKVKYKATPGFNYPAGTYTTDVIYTATQQ